MRAEWYAAGKSGALNTAFEALLPHGFVFHERVADTGALRWRKPICGNFFFQVSVNWTSELTRAVRFQTTAALGSTDLPALKLRSGYYECFPSNMQEQLLEPPQNDLIASVYVEGFARISNGSRVELHSWSPSTGVSDGSAWTQNVRNTLGIFGNFDLGAEAVCEAILETDRLAGTVRPTPFMAEPNIYLAAALVCISFGDFARAKKYIEMGYEKNWAQSPGDDQVEGELASCLAEKLLASIATH